MASRTNSLILFVIALTGFILGYVYVSDLDPAIDAGIVPLPLKLSAAAVEELKDVSVNYEFLGDPLFTELRVFGELPVQPGTGGTTNPFQ